MRKRCGRSSKLTVRRSLVRRVIAVAVIAVVGSCATHYQLPLRTALDVYVNSPDATYRWDIVGEYKTERGTTHVLDLKSQNWLTKAEVNRPEWQHWMVIFEPEEITSDTALLFIGGGKNGGEPPQSTDQRLEQLAVATKTVTVQLGMVPNQPLVFAGSDGKPRVEDDLLGFAWAKHLENQDPFWLPRMAMVKSAVRAMDATQEYLGSREQIPRTISHFVVAGGSKRGWTTWLTGAVDSRVVAIVPIVIDVLNVVPSMKHHHAAYGFWAPAVHDYVEHGLMEKIDSAGVASILELVDPYSYRHRLTMPKFILNAAGDQFFLPDSSRFYWSGLRGENYLRYVPNTDHSLRKSDAHESLLAYYHAIVTDTPRPRFSWKILPNGSIHVETVDRPSEVNIWTAVNPGARDFRLETLGPAFVSRPLGEETPGVYVARESIPEKGWKAFFVELTFGNSDGETPPLKFTSGVSVLPDELPFE